jgi:hypothetical protein
MAGTLPGPPHDADDDRLFLPGWTGWRYVTWMPSVFSENYGLDLKKSSLFFAGTLWSPDLAH